MFNALHKAQSAQTALTMEKDLFLRRGTKERPHLTFKIGSFALWRKEDFSAILQRLTLRAEIDSHRPWVRSEI